MRDVRSSSYGQSATRATPSATFVPSASVPSDVATALALDRSVPLHPPSRCRAEESVSLAQSSVRSGELPRQASLYADTGYEDLSPGLGDREIPLASRSFPTMGTTLSYSQLQARLGRSRQGVCGCS